MRNPAESLAIVEQLYEEGLEMKRAQLRRELPALSEGDLEDLIRQWILDRPFDFPGRVTKL